MPIGSEVIQRTILHRHRFEGGSEVVKGVRGIGRAEKLAHKEVVKALKEKQKAIKEETRQRTSQHRHFMQMLALQSKAERREHKAFMRNHEEAGKLRDQQIQQFKIAAAKILAIAGAWAAANKSLNTYLKNTQLGVATVGADVGRVQKAFKGLVTETEAAQFAADLMSSSFGATQGEMENAARMVVVLTSRGKDLKKALDEVTKAMVEGNAEGLKQLGVNIKTESDTLQGFSDINKEFARQVRKDWKDATVTGEEARKSNVRLKDSIDDLEHSFGKFIASLSPQIDLVSQGFKGLAIAISEPLGTLKAFGSFFSGGNLFGTRVFVDMEAFRKNLERIKILTLQIRQDKEATRIAEQQLRQADKEFEAIGRKIAQLEANEKRKDAARNKPRRKSRGGGGVRFLQDESFERFIAMENARIQRELDSLMDKALSEGALARTGKSFLDQEERTFLSQRSGFAPEEQGFGTPETLSGFEAFKESLPTDALKSFTDTGIGALQGLERAAKTAFTAMISGAGGAGEAFRRLSADAIVGMGAEMGILALKETALGFASLALGPIGGASASAHFKAAATAAGFALSAAGAAQALGGSPIATGAGNSVGGTLGGAGLSSGGSSSSVNFFMGDEFGGLSARERAARTSQLLDIADAEGDRGSSITFD